MVKKTSLAKEVSQVLADLNAIVANRKIEGWVGSLPSEIAPGSIPLGEMRGRKFRWNPVGQGGQLFPEDPDPKHSHADGGPFNLSLNAGVRSYYTSNVLRLADDTLDSGVVESNAGFSLMTKPQEIGRYLTLIPRVDFLMMWAN